jgi:hypothetical protein
MELFMSSEMKNPRSGYRLIDDGHISAFVFGFIASPAFHCMGTDACCFSFFFF